MVLNLLENKRFDSPLGGGYGHPAEGGWLYDMWRSGVRSERDESDSAVESGQDRFTECRRGRCV